MTRTRTITRTVTTSTVTLLLGGLCLAVGSSPAQAATTTSSTVSREAGADAVVTDYPAHGHPVPGRAYHDTIVSTAVSASRADGTTTRGAFAWFASTTYSFDAAGTYVEGAQTSGYADGSAVRLLVDRALRTAHLRATVPATTCDQGICTNVGPLRISVDWTATGAISHVAGRQRLHKGTTTVTSRTDGDSRTATAVATPFGRTATASLWRGTSRQRTVVRP